jgi:hypothetical protein
MPSSPASASAALPVPINLGALCSNGGLRSGPGRARRGGEEKEKSIGLIRNGAGLVTIPATHAHHHPSRWTASKEKTHQTLGPDVRNEPGRPASRDVTWGGGGVEAAGILAFCTLRLIISFFQKPVTSGLCFHRLDLLGCVWRRPSGSARSERLRGCLPWPPTWCGGTGRRFYVNTLFVAVWWLGIDMAVDMDMDMEWPAAKSGHAGLGPDTVENESLIDEELGRCKPSRGAAALLILPRSSVHQRPPAFLVSVSSPLLSSPLVSPWSFDLRAKLSRRTSFSFSSSSLLFLLPVPPKSMSIV